MSVTEAEYAEFRRKLGGDETSMPDAYIDTIFEQAEGDYPGADRRVIRAAAVYEGALNLQAEAAIEVDYNANASGERLSQRFDHLQKIVDAYKKMLDTELKDRGSAVAWGVVRKIPTRNKEYPDT